MNDPFTIILLMAAMLAVPVFFKYYSKADIVQRRQIKFHAVAIFIVAAVVLCLFRFR